jgi:DNA-binding NarL/FixJ family response regulator
MISLRILIADDDASMRSALGEMLDSEPGYEVVAFAEDSEAAVELAAQHQPDVAILDVKMPRGGGIRAAEGIRAASPRTCILALSAWDDRETIQRMRRAGAAGYLVKGSAPDELFEVMERHTRSRVKS